ncbi:hypothetical protein ACJX0J_015168, partial [Zea mays]
EVATSEKHHAEKTNSISYSEVLKLFLEQRRASSKDGQLSSREEISAFQRGADAKHADAATPNDIAAICIIIIIAFAVNCDHHHNLICEQGGKKGSQYITYAEGRRKINKRKKKR